MKPNTPVDSCCPPDNPQAVHLIVGPLDDPRADADLAAFAKAVGHPIRVRILRMLARKEARMCSHIVDELPLAQSTVSEHLRILKLSLIHISEPTRLGMISYAVFCLKKKTEREDV